MIIHGEIVKILTQKENDWGRYSVKTNERTYLAVGVIPNPSIGMTVLLNGYEETNQYGEQFKVQEVLSSEESACGGVRAFFDEYIKGIGPAKAELLIQEFGLQCLEMFDTKEGRGRLSKVKGITQNIISNAMPSYEKYKHLIPIIMFLNGSGTKNQIESIYEKYGEKSSEILRKNPYRLQIDLDGFGFKKTDRLAMAAGVEPGSIYRIMAAAKFTLEESQSQGHCYLPAGELRTSVMVLLAPPPKVHNCKESSVERIMGNWDDEKKRTNFIKKYQPTQDETDQIISALKIRQDVNETLTEALIQAVEEEVLVMDGDKVYTSQMYTVETGCAKLALSMLESNPVRYVKKETIDKAIREMEAKKTAAMAKNGGGIFAITPEQRNAATTCLMHRFSILSGGPGRGKTTILELIAHAFLLSGIYDTDDILMLAPTGRAAQRISESTGYESMTAQRAIYRAKGTGETPTRKLVVVDESSMLDIFLFYDILKYTRDCNLIIVGDVDQIESVGPGKVLRDLIQSGRVPCTILTKGHRNTGNIAHNAELIKQGKKLEDYSYGNDFVYFPASKETIADKVIEDYVASVRKYGIENVMLCTAMRERGPVAVSQLNNKLQYLYAAGKKKPFVRIGSQVFYIDDRVMQTKNNYSIEIQRKSGSDFGVFNGERGSIKKIYTNEFTGEITIHVLFDDGSSAVYDANTAKDLTLAYATTLHKCQGSEAECMMMAYVWGDYLLLNRSLFYTGETRAKKEFRFYGEEKRTEYGQLLSAFDIAVRTTKSSDRYTSLCQYLSNEI